MLWVDSQEASYWKKLGWEIVDFYDHDISDDLLIVRHVSHHVKQNGIRTRDVLGAGFIGLGTAMLIPGPVDVAAAAAGVALFKHPGGAVAGIIVYNVAALSLIAAGSVLISS